jgi:hypothetical protein
MEVETTEEGANVIRKTVSEADAKFIRLTDDGRIDKDFLNQCENNEGNIGKLKEIVNNERVVQFNVSDNIDYKDELGIIRNEPMGPININFSNMGAYTPSTGERGNAGVTQYPGVERETYNAPYNKTVVTINKNLTLQGQAEVTGHELYGHAYLNIKGWNSSHIFMNYKDGIGERDSNPVTKHYISASMKEVQSYFKK